ncbi:MAG: DUF2490 domain-containing protein [Crocinitomicaceae bacterium]|nr:DUF2490 domain-containing protein [Crocinitomicaceae bacterium]
MIVIVLSFCFSTKLFSQDFANSNQQWIHYYSQIDLNQKNRIGFDGGFRWKDACSEPALFLVRVSYWQKIKPNLSLGIGIAHTGSFSNREINTLELRPYQELLYLKKKEKLTVQIRYRSEERLFSDFHEGTANTKTFVLRNRFAFSYTFFIMKPFKNLKIRPYIFFLEKNYL